MKKIALFSALFGILALAGCKRCCTDSCKSTHQEQHHCSTHETQNNTTSHHDVKRVSGPHGEKSVNWSKEDYR